MKGISSDVRNGVFLPLIFFLFFFRLLTVLTLLNDRLYSGKLGLFVILHISLLGAPVLFKKKIQICLFTKGFIKSPVEKGGSFERQEESCCLLHYILC